MIDPRNVAFFVPSELKNFKRKLFDRIGDHIKKQGGRVIVGDWQSLDALPPDILPIIGCSPYLKEMVQRWRGTGRRFVYWDRGAVRRIFATDLPPATDGSGYYRWCVNAFQMREIRAVSGDRWKALKTDLWPWAKDGKHIVVAEPSPTYQRFHGIEGWTERTLAVLKTVTDRPIVIRDKEMQRFGRKLHEDLKGAHCLVTHGSNAAVEAVIMGCPVFVHPDSAAALVGKTDTTEIEAPVYPDRMPWCHSLAHSQFSEPEMTSGALWQLLA